MLPHQPGAAGIGDQLAAQVDAHSLGARFDAYLPRLRLGHGFDGTPVRKRQAGNRIRALQGYRKATGRTCDFYSLTSPDMVFGQHSSNMKVAVRCRNRAAPSSKGCGPDCAVAI
ncbi:hypothetical protein Ntsu_06150 [Nocardia sp. IFM 10818]